MACMAPKGGESQRLLLNCLLARRTMLSQRHRLQLDENPSVLVEERKRHESNQTRRTAASPMSHASLSRDSLFKIQGALCRHTGAKNSQLQWTKVGMGDYLSPAAASHTNLARPSLLRHPEHYWSF
jgi:hypothetical protein